MGAPGMTTGMQGGNRLYAGSFWHQVRKKPELWSDKSKVKMKDALDELKALFVEAKEKSEFDFVLTLINYRGMYEKELNINLHEWFDAIEFYKELYRSNEGKKKARMACLLYSTFFENSDFYNIIGSLCRISLGFKGSSYLFWKTRKYERLLGIGEKQDYLIELLDDAAKPNIISFFEENHVKEIRNSFFHSAYGLDEEEYHMHDTEPIPGVGLSFNLKTFFYPKVENVILFFDLFKQLYLESVASYQEEKTVDGKFPNPVKATIIGSKEGLRGFRIKNAVQFYGEWHDSGIWYDEKYQMWAGHNINMYFDNLENIEMRDGLVRYLNKSDINKNDIEFHNLIDKVIDRQVREEIAVATELLVRFGNARFKKMEAEGNAWKKKSMPKIILPYYRRAVEIGSKVFDMTELKKRIEALEAMLE